MDGLLLMLTLMASPVLVFPDRFASTSVALLILMAWLLKWRSSGRLLRETPLNAVA